MAGLNVSDSIQVRVLGTLLGQKTVNTFYYQIVIPSITADPITACQSWADTWGSGAVSPFLSFLECCPQNYTADTIEVQKIYPERFRPTRNNIGLPGTRPNDAQTANVSAVITRAGIQAGRAFVGSLHIPGVAEADQNGGLIGNTLFTKMGTLGSKMLNAFTDTFQATVGNPVLYHWRRPPLAYVNPSLLYTTIPQRTIRVMRRRTVGVGK